MANVFPPVRTESRTPEKMLVELYSFENATHEITSTINVSLHGARVLTKVPWRPISMFPFDRSPVNFIPAHISFIANHFPTGPIPSGCSCLNRPRAGQHPANQPRRSALSDSH